MSSIQIDWQEKIAENQQFCSTWIASIADQKCIVKKIVSDDNVKLTDLANNLKRQVRFSEILNDEEKKKICLFDTMTTGDGYIAFSREWKDGKSLEQMIAQKRYTVEEATKLILEITGIVQLAYAHNVSHGDLKPANIIIDEQGNVSIIDWDTMSLCESVEGLMADGRTISMEPVFGTPQYMPIEQFQGQKVDQQCDIYAIGVILYQLLTGETPFDSAGPQTAAQMAIYKQQHELDSILVKFPSLGVSSDLARIIDESLKNDKNQRIQTLDDLKQCLETIGKISASQMRQAEAVVKSEKYVAPKEKGKEHKIVLIGHTGAGKTVLAAGLYATQDKDFAVDDPGSKTQTGVHAINTKTIIEDGHWPAATGVGDITRLKFKLNYKGKEESISFDEYAGERLAMENYDKLILGEPDGAFILLNPGGEQWHSTREKNSLLSDMKHYIDLLSKKKNNPPVALVITASDRLESDLKDFAPKFRKYIDELKNSLEVHKCNYEIFEVSVSGVLENQNKPQLNPQHIKDPFVWLIKQFTSKARKQTAKKISKFISIAAVIAAVISAGEWFREGYTNSSLKEKFDNCQKEYNKTTKSEDDLIDFRKNLIELRNEQCALKHVASTKRKGKCSENCLPRFFYSTQEANYDKLLTELELMIDKTNHEYFAKKLNDALVDATKENRKVVDWIKNWQPLQDNNKNLQVALQAQSNEKMPAAIERFDTRDIEQRLDELIENPCITFPAQLADDYSAWQQLSTVLPKEERENNIKHLKALELKARQAVEEKHYTSLLATLENINETMPTDISNQLESWAKHTTSFDSAVRESKNNKIANEYLAAAKRVFRHAADEQRGKISKFSGDEDALANLIREFEKFKQRSFIDVSSETINAEIGLLQALIYKKTDALIEQIHAKYHDSQMERDTYSGPAYKKTLTEKVLTLLDVFKRHHYENLIDSKISSTKQAWNNVQEQKVKSFVSVVQYRSASEALDEFKGFYYENINNPYMGNAENKILEIVNKEIKTLIKNFDYKEQSYRGLKELCAKIRNIPSENSKKTFAYRFACKFYAWMDSNPTHTITINGIDASSWFKEGAYIYNSDYVITARGNEGKQISNWKNLIQKNEVPFYSSWKQIIPQFTVSCRPWEYMAVDFTPYENIEWDFDRKLSYQIVRIYPGDSNSVYFAGQEIKNNGSYAEISFDSIGVRFYFAVSGKTILDIYREANAE